MRIIKCKKEILKVDKSVPTIGKKIDTYLLIDENKEVYAGNSFVENLDDCYCIVVEKDELLEKVCKEFETAIVEENSNSRIENLAKEINTYVRNQMKKDFQSDLGLDLRERRGIEDTSFDQPPEYNFKKSKRGSKKKEEMEEDKDKISLF